MANESTHLLHRRATKQKRMMEGIDDALKLNRRQDTGPAEGAVGQISSQVNGGLAPSRGNAADPSTSSTGGDLAPSRGNDGGGATTSSSQNNAAPWSSSSQNTWNQGGGQAPATTSQWTDNNNNNNGGNGNNNNNNNGNNGDNGNNGQQNTNQWNQPTTSSQQQQWNAPSSSSSSQNNWNTWENNNNQNNGGNTWQQQQTTWQQVSSSNTWGQPVATSAQAPTNQAASQAITTSSSQAQGLAAAPSSSAPIAAVSPSGISDTTNANNADNADLANSASSSKSPKLGGGAAAGIAIAILALLGLIAGLLLYRRRKQRATRDRSLSSGNVRDMSERHSTGSSFYNVHNASSASGGFITFHDNASTHTTIPGSPSGGIMLPGTPIQPAHAAFLMPREEQPDEDDASHYDNETYESHGDMGRPTSNYYNTAAAAPYDSLHSPRMPEYNIPTPPLPAFDQEEAILSSRPSNLGYLRNPSSKRLAPANVRRLSSASQQSYVDEQLRDLYVGHY